LNLNGKIERLNTEKDTLKANFSKTPQPNPIPNSADVCFLMDCTGSMSSWIKACKTQLNDIVNLISKHYPHITVNIAFVGYHDIADDPRFEILPFTTDVEKVKHFINENVLARGGGDIPEDVCGGMRKALDLPWTAENR